MRQPLIIILLFIFSSFHTRSQSRNEQINADTGLASLVSSILLKNSGADSILVTPIDSQHIESLISRITRTAFLRDMEIEFATTDNKKLMNIIARSPGFQTPERLAVRNIIMLTNAEVQRDYLNIRQKYNYIPLIEISNLVLSTDKQTCHFFYHIIQSVGESVVLHKNSNGIWSIVSEHTDWLE